MELNDRIKRLFKCKFSELQWFQGDLVESTKRDIETLERSIKKAFIDPFLVWCSHGGIKILSGHRRWLVLDKNKYQGEVNCVEIECKDEREAGEYVLKYRTSYGRMENEGLYKFLNYFDLDIKSLKNELKFQDINLGSFQQGYIDEFDFSSVSDELDGGFQIKDYDFSDFIGKDYFQMPEIREDMLFDLPENITVWCGPDLESYDSKKKYMWKFKTYSRTLENWENVVLNFYTDDSIFDRFFIDYEKYLAKILNLGIRHATMPNFSLYRNEPIAIQILNSYRSKWLARIMQEVGIKIIPDINYSTENSYKFCFNGLPKGVPVIVQNQGIKVNDNESIDYHLKGIQEAYIQLGFPKLYIYGGLEKRYFYDELEGFEIVFVESFNSKRNRLRKESKNAKVN